MLPLNIQYYYNQILAFNNYLRIVFFQKDGPRSHV